MYLNTSPASKKYYLSDISPALEKPGKYLKTPFRRRRSIYTHLSGAGEVLIYTYLAPERSEKPEKYLYTPDQNTQERVDSGAVQLDCVRIERNENATKWTDEDKIS